MSDMGELFSDLREIGKAKRERNREHAPTVLTAAGIDFESKNGGAHLVVSGASARADLWPGTGLWIVRGTSKRGRGVANLVQHLTKGRKP